MDGSNKVFICDYVFGGFGLCFYEDIDDGKVVVLYDQGDDIDCVGLVFIVLVEQLMKMVCIVNNVLGIGGLLDFKVFDKVVVDDMIVLFMVQVYFSWLCSLFLNLVDLCCEFGNLFSFYWQVWLIDILCLVCQEVVVLYGVVVFCVLSKY